ncbi:MAG: Outer rane receptor protein, mostly Fe transport [Bacteroidetes bacterium]|nr:Outer rane receptor protein, mostly Fe transport [Bacteroidota bacterium]
MRHTPFRSCFPSLMVLSLFISNLFAGTTGKIVGKVTESGKEALVGVNILIDGTKLGAATEVDGQYIIINVPPGIFSLTASSLGYQTSRITNVRVSVDLTTHIDFELKESAIQMNEEIVTVAQRPMIQKDLTSSSSKVSAEQIKAYPVEDVAALVNLQAGVVEGHFRGGRSGEVLYMIDGIPVTDAYSGNAGLSAETNSIQELEIISGTFNAEYGQALSGVVNQVTKDGGEKLTGDVSVYTGDYVSPRKSLYQNIGNVRPSDIYNIEASAGGPVIGLPDVTFFVSGRLYHNDGYLYGKRTYLPVDSSDYSSDDPSRWYREKTGDNAFVPMNSDKRATLQGKLSFSLFGSDKLRLQFLHQQSDFRRYDHRYKYNPDGTYSNFVRGNLASINYTSVFSKSTFLETNAAWFSNREKSYVYEDPFDPRLIPISRRPTAGGSSFLTGGAEPFHRDRESRYLSLKGDLVSQITFEHQIKIGVEGKVHRIWIHNFIIRNDQTTGYKPVPYDVGNSELAHTTLRPRQYAAYVQDKMEFEDFIVNLGVRFDYFNPKANALAEPLTLVKLVTTPARSESQVSPRIGISYPITDRGVLHLSYGHFFQVPQFDLLYLNPSYNIDQGNAFQVGNPALKSQRTVAYELGLQQQMSDDIKIDVSGYYKDFRNLVGTEIFDIGNGTIYSQYVNRDYGNARGIVVSVEKRHTHGFSATLDYTFQIAQGNASDPNSVFQDNQTNPPRESQKQLAPLDWDRRNSLNATATIGTLNDFTVTIIGRLGTGLPYTPASFNARTGLVNSENKPTVTNVDLYLTKYFSFFGSSVNVFAKVYNLFDTQNELDVFSDTGRAGYALQHDTPRGDVNTVEEYYTRPDFYSAPRQIVLGLGVSL